jgi:hypothetical protein
MVKLCGWSSQLLKSANKGTHRRPLRKQEMNTMLKFFRTLRRDDRGDQLVGWVLLVSFVVLVGAGAWGAMGDNIKTVITAAQTETKAAADAITPAP